MCAFVISEDDVKSIVRLLGETAAVEGDHTEKKRFLIDGLCTLIEVDAWVWALGCQIKPGGVQTYVGFMHGGLDPDRFSKLLLALEHPGSGEFAEKFYEKVNSSKQHVTMLRDEIDVLNKAEQIEAGQYWRDADIGSLILSSKPLDQDSMSSIGLYRRVNDTPFSNRDKKIAHIILSEVAWLHMLGWPENRGVKVPKLYPRQRIVLNLLLDGMVRKQIADQMSITENTVSGYTKDIYRHFEVNSHVELMSKFLHGNLGDRD